MTIRIKEATTYEDGTTYMELACASTDTKPVEGVATGSVAVEADTGDKYLFDEDGQEWHKA